MNDAKLNKRQDAIVKFLDKRGLSSRLEILSNLSKDKASSRITIIRDLNKLMTLGIIDVKGKGKATKYFIRQRNQILLEVDLDEYFKKDIYDRGANKEFNKKIYGSLTGLYSKSEVALWEKSAKDLSERSQKLNPTIYKRELERFVIELSWKSSQIEGNTYTLLETETLIKQRIRAKGRTESEAIMILNHKQVFDDILKNKSNYKKLSLAKLEEFHQHLVSGLGISEGVRRERVGITGTLYRPPTGQLEIHENLLALIDFVNNTPYPPEKALIISFMVAYLQPFMDGNKRTSRMLSNAILLANGFYPLSYRDVDVDEYKKALILFYEQNNLYHFKKMFMEQLRFAMENYFRI